MVKVDLITGFLGSGKTTFIKKYAQYLIDQGYRIGIIENDFGAVNVDMMLLQDLESENCELEMVAGACDKDCHQRRFKTKLISMGMRDFDRVLVEPSGIFDVEEFFDVLHEEPLTNWYEIGNVFAIVDASLEKNLSKEASYLLASQIVSAGKIILSKVDTTSKERIVETIQQMNDALALFHGKPLLQERLKIKKWDEMTQEDYQELLNSQYTNDYIEKLWFNQNDAFQSLYYMNNRFNQDEFIQKINHIFKDQDCGHVMRVKGFYQKEKHWYEINMTQENTSIQEINQGQDVIIVIGEELNKNKILLKLISKNLSFGLFNSAISKLPDIESNEETLYEKFMDTVNKNNINLKNPKVTLFTIIELVSSTAFSSILYSEPLTLEEYKPYLYSIIRNILREKI